MAKDRFGEGSGDRINTRADPRHDRGGGRSQPQRPEGRVFRFSADQHIIGTVDAERGRRIKLLDDLLRERLDNSGRFKTVPIPPEMQRRIADGPEISGCNGCERGYATTIGADWAAWGTVQKVSNLILNINLYIEGAADGKLKFVKSVDIRGNTDESWWHGLDYMLRHYLFGEP